MAMPNFQSSNAKVLARDTPKPKREMQPKRVASDKFSACQFAPRRYSVRGRIISL